jgi:hypothetical protein
MRTRKLAYPSEKQGICGANFGRVNLQPGLVEPNLRHGLAEQYSKSLSRFWLGIWSPNYSIGYILISPQGPKSLGIHTNALLTPVGELIREVASKGSQGSDNSGYDGGEAL